MGDATAGHTWLSKSGPVYLQSVSGGAEVGRKWCATGLGRWKARHSGPWRHPWAFVDEPGPSWEARVWIQPSWHPVPFGIDGGCHRKNPGRSCPVDAYRGGLFGPDTRHGRLRPVGKLVCRRRQSQHPSVRVPGRMGGWWSRIWRWAWSQRQRGDSQIDEDSAWVSQRSFEPHPICLHTQALLVAQSNWVVVLDSRPALAQALKFLFDRCSSKSDFGIHRILQRAHGQAVRVDVQRKAAGGLNYYWRTSKGQH